MVTGRARVRVRVTIWCFVITRDMRGFLCAAALWKKEVWVRGRHGVVVRCFVVSGYGCGVWYR